jgi:hypothetical protein
MNAVNIAIYATLTSLVEDLVTASEAFHGVRSFHGVRAIAALKKALGKYFSFLRDQLLEHLSALPEDNPVAINHVLNQTIEDASSILNAILTLHLQTIYLQGYQSVKESIQEAIESRRTPENAATYARKVNALVADLNATSRSRLAEIIARGIERHKGIYGVMKQIRLEFPDFSLARREAIARTEMGNGWNAGILDRLVERGIKRKRIRLGLHPCPTICIPNYKQGSIPIGAPFASGHQAPAFHPNCDCTIVGVKVA